MNREYSQTIRRIVLTGLFFAMALVLSMVEASLPIPVPVPGVRFGLSNIVVMYTLFYLSKREAVIIVLLKALFVLATRGVVAGLLSFCGGVLSICVLIVLTAFLREKLSLLLLGVTGAVFHNLGQLIGIYFIYRFWLIPYIPVLILAGIVAGFVTSVSIKALLPVMRKLQFK